jgi:uncharacterized short protein YbdD (DUF466 family)
VDPGIDMTLRLRLRRVAVVIRRVIGVPDYEAYLAHCRLRHPDVTPLAREAFTREQLRARYEKPGARCC